MRLILVLILFAHFCPRPMTTLRSGTAGALVPIQEYRFGFTTSSISLENIEHLLLNDAALGVHKASAKTPHCVVKPPAPEDPQQCGPDLPELAWEAKYPKGSINPSAPIPGGFSFYLSGPTSFADHLLAGATEAVFSYRMMLSRDWEWVKGGKLPGVFGGAGELSYRCTGGRQNDRCRCFNIRPMWRENSLGEAYPYLPLTANNEEQLLSVPPVSKKNADYGFSVGRGSFNLAAAVGSWVTIAIRIKMNDIGQENGELQLWMDGVSAISVSGLTLRDSAESHIKGMHFQTFFGGHTDDWASPKDQFAWFADVTGVIVR
ncbi:hypothetical protein HGRIS_007657 [Hohenbuehelia grisea]|uniref:Polysaccharide lyase 14 domain-containing protein n=1 Tax=Hohenbuehelia grisea TaxID=104357 RepID=A0ABR3J5I7_9AGAR